MPEITDNTIKKKHKEFDDRINAVLLELRGGSAQSGITRLRQKFLAKLQSKGMIGGNGR